MQNKIIGDNSLDLKKLMKSAGKSTYRSKYEVFSSLKKTLKK